MVMDTSYLESLETLMATDETTTGGENGGIWVVASATAEGLSSWSGKLVAEARLLADQLGSYVQALLLGSVDERWANALLAAGADGVHMTGTMIPALDAMADFVTEREVEVLLFADTPLFRQYAAALGGKLAKPFLSGCTALEIDPETSGLLVQRPVMGNRINEMVAMGEGVKPQIVALFPEPLPEPFDDLYRTGDVETVDLPEETGWPWAGGEPVEEPLQPPRLQDAKIVVAGGRGMAEAGWSLVEALAEALGGVVAGSRGAVDEGLIGEERMVDLVGHRIAPDLYVACGISGQMQHNAAIEQARMVVAINHNPEAPIFKVADVGLVGNVAEIIPALVEAVEAKKRSA